MVGSIKIDLVGMGIPCFQNSHTGYNSTLVICFLLLFNLSFYAGIGKGNLQSLRSHGCEMDCYFNFSH